MSPASYRTAPPRVGVPLLYELLASKANRRRGRRPGDRTRPARCEGVPHRAGTMQHRAGVRAVGSATGVPVVTVFPADRRQAAWSAGCGSAWWRRGGSAGRNLSGMTEVVIYTDGA